MEKIIAQIQKFKPNLKENSIKTYLVSLKKINKCVGDDQKEDKFKFPEDPSFLKDTDKVLDCIKDELDTTKKNRLSAIVVYLKSFEDDKNLKIIDTYSKEMESVALKYQKQIDKQELTKKQKDNLITMDEFKDIINDMFNQIVLQKLYKKTELNNKEYSELQNYILLRLYLEYPLRNDLAEVMIINSKKSDNGSKNYLLVRKESVYLLLNKYKTDKIYGKKVYKFDDNLVKLVNLLLKHNKSGYLLTKYNRRDPISKNDLTKLLNRIFRKQTGKTIGTSLLRHIQISEDRKNTPTIKEIEESNKKIEDRFLHSNSMNQEYRKIK